MTVDRSHGYGGIVNHAVDDHIRHGGFHRNRVCRDLCNFPGQLVRAVQAFTFWVYAHFMILHYSGPCHLVIWGNSCRLLRKAAEE
jgi:hypothetical protein